ncbi:MAG: protein-disulfide reductase DsbD domain-containing protein [Pseudomarimonas sp.]
MSPGFPISLAVAGLACMLPTAVAAAPLPNNALRTDHLRSQLVAQTTTAVAGQSLRLGLLLEHDPHWHTYWRNPGDSGLATKIEFELPAGVTVGEIEWPAPQRFDVEGIVNFGYADTLLLPITLTIPADFAGASIPIAATASWLICEIECIPGRGTYPLELPIAGAATADPRWVAHFEWAAKRQPKSLEAESSIRLADNHVLIDIVSNALPPDIAAWEVFPLAAQVIVNGAHPMWSKFDGGKRMRLPLSDAFAGLPAQFDFLLVKDDIALAVNARVTPSP